MIELRILGTPELRQTAGEGVAALHLQPKRLALLGYLALATSTRYCRRDTLLVLFWPELDEEHARNALSQAVHGLRRTLGKQAVMSKGAEELRVSPESLWCDAVAFERALAKEHLTAALDLYRGPLLDGLHLSAALEFDHWLDTERERFRRRAAEAAAALAARDEAAGNLAGATHWLRRLLALAPDNEGALQRLMPMLDRLGDRVGALRAYETFAQRLAQDLDLPPAPETRALAARFRARPEGASGPAESALPSVAVLPFANLSPDPEQAYFCDGMTEEIINVLAQIRGLRVAARTSAFAFKDQPVDVRTLAHKLGVDSVIEGSVRRAGERLRITVQLVDATGGYHLWSARYDRPLRDVFAIQDEIAQAVATTLRAELLQAPDRRQGGPSTANMEAHALYLKGLFQRRKRTPEALRKACASFQQATEHDPDYAQAHAALAFTYALGGWFLYDVFTPRHAYPLAREAAETALALNDRLPEAHLALAYTCLAFDWDAPGAERAFRQALDLDPDNADTLGNYASFLVLRQRYEEALAVTRRIEALDPYWIMPRVAQGIWLLAARRYEEAIARLRQAHEMAPEFYVAPLFLGDAYRFAGRYDEAETAYTHALHLPGPRPLTLGRLGALYALTERPEAALQILAELHALEEERPVLPAIRAGIYLALADHDQALLWLEKAIEERDTMLTLLGYWPAYDPIRSHRRFRVLLEKVGLAR